MKRITLHVTPKIAPSPRTFNSRLLRVQLLLLWCLLPSAQMAEADWDEVTYLHKKTPRAADARSQKVGKRSV